MECLYEIVRMHVRLEVRKNIFQIYRVSEIRYNVRDMILGGSGKAKQASSPVCAIL